MTQYGALRVWSALVGGLGALAALLAAAGTIIWAVEVDGAWPTLGVLALGGSGTLFLAGLATAAAQALRALADVGETVSAR
ncbi:MAG TPA: hypothetical protein VNJ46_07065 [Gaiellaceae bacterium]|nr:hypothetical protein [Gaiellaceae bacterium]